MAQRYNTFNPRPSNSMKDLNDNTLAYDDFLNSDKEVAHDRFQKPFPTVRRQVAERIDEITGAQKSIEQYADEAKQSADNAQNIADANTYYTSPTDPNGTIAGIAGTPDGKSFRVAIQDATLSVVAFNYYLNKGGVAEFITSYPNKRYLDMVSALATSTDTRTQGLRMESESVYPGEWLTEDGDGLLFFGFDGTTNAPGGVVTKSVETKKITAVSEPDDLYPLAELTLDDDVLFATDPTTGRKIYMGEPLHNHRGPLSGDCFVIGDSLAAFGVAWSGDNNTGENRAPCLNDKGFYTWAMMQSLGRIRVTGISATGGYTVSQVWASHLFNAIAAKPTFCPVMCGRNDILLGVDLDNVTIPAFEMIFLQLRWAGIIPVVCTMAAQANGSDDGRRTNEHKLNNWLRAYARRYRLPLVDFHRYTVDPTTGSWLPGYNRDASHPTGEGAKAMGKAMVDGLLQWTATTFPPRADEQIAAGLTANLLANPLFLNNDGTNPTDWTITTVGTASISQDPAVKGNVWNLSNHAASLGVTAVPGKRYQFGVLMKTAGSNLFECYALSGGGSSTTHLAGVRKWGTPTDGWVYFCYEFVVPDGISDITLKLSAATSQCSIGEINLIKITEIE